VSYGANASEGWLDLVGWLVLTLLRGENFWLLLLLHLWFREASRRLHPEGWLLAGCCHLSDREFLGS